MTEQEKYYLDQMIMDALTVNTDEIEGQQVINLNDLDVCATDYARTSIISDPSYDMTILKELLLSTLLACTRLLSNSQRKKEAKNSPVFMNGLHMKLVLIAKKR